MYGIDIASISPLKFLIFNNVIHINVYYMIFDIYKIASIELICPAIDIDFN